MKLGSRYLMAAAVGTVAICAGIWLSLRWLRPRHSEGTDPDGPVKTNSVRGKEKDPKHSPAKAEGGDISMDDIAGIYILAFLRNVAFEDEKPNHWIQITNSWYASKKRPLRFFEEILTQIDPSGLNSAVKGRLDEAQKDELKGLPLLLIWLILDRKKPLRQESLWRSSFLEGHGPENEDVAKRLLIRRVKESAEKSISKRARNRDILLEVQLTILKWMASPKSGSRNWSVQTKTRVQKRLLQKIKESPATAHGYYLREAMRKALIQVSGKQGVAEELRTPVWTKAKFKQWLDRVEPEE